MRKLMIGAALIASSFASPPTFAVVDQHAVESCVYRDYLTAARAEIPDESLWDLIVPNYWWFSWLKSRESATAEGRYASAVEAVAAESAAWFVHPYDEVQSELSLWKDLDVIRGWIDAEIRLETGGCK